MSQNTMGQTPQNEAQKAKSRALKPSAFWCRWQFIRGINFRHLTIPDADLRKKWIIITGGNSGIGKEAALQFAKWGANLVLGCREPPPHEPHPDVVVQECQAVARMAGHQDSKIEWWMCDMAKLSSVQTFGERWLATGLPLDILANNAGIGGDPRVAILTEDGFEVVHQVNFLAHVLLTLTLLPSLQKAPEPRIICTTSCMQYLGVFDLANANAGINAYPNNKLYFQTWLTELHSRMMRQTDYKHITIQGVHPGFVKSNIWVPLLAEMTSMNRGVWILNSLLKYVAIDTQQGSLAITNAATSPEWGTDLGTQGGDKKGGKGGGKFANRIWHEEPMPQTKDPECRREVWEFVGNELKLQERGLLNVLGI